MSKSYPQIAQSVAVFGGRELNGAIDLNEVIRVGPTPIWLVLW